MPQKCFKKKKTVLEILKTLQFLGKKGKKKKSVLLSV